MDGSLEKWAARWGLPAHQIQRTTMQLTNGTTFDLAEYLRAQAEGTEWLRDRMERHVGMATFVETWLPQHKPHKTHPERTLKSFVFQEAESMSRAAKVACCQQNGHAVLSLQHDGIVVALRQGAAPDVVSEQLQEASELKLGYDQPCEIKPAELPPGIAMPEPISRERIECMMEAHRQSMNARASPGHQGSQAITRGESVEEAGDRLGHLTVRRPAPPPSNSQPTPRGLWAAAYLRGDPEQYAANAISGIRRDPILRLHLRSEAIERGSGVAARTGISVRMDETERTTMSSQDAAGISAATTQTARAMWCALDLHAHHHFTHAAAVDGSLMEQSTPERRLTRQLAFGVYEGMLP